jgi:hypothetical protein
MYYSIALGLALGLMAGTYAAHLFCKQHRISKMELCRRIVNLIGAAFRQWKNN